MSGTIALSDADRGSTSSEGRVVELVDGDNVVVAQGTTNAAGAFTIALETSSLNLSATGGRVLTLRSLFLNGEATPSALGLRQQLAIPADSPTAVFDLGSQSVKRVGAIVGRVTLETNADPTGTDIYIPGTTNLAKTDASGRYILGFLPPGTFQLRADRDGFSSHEWQGLVVEANKTLSLPDTVLGISTGPRVIGFTLENGSNVTFATNVTLLIKFERAAKYRISQLSDFRDTTYRPLNAATNETRVPFVVAGRDGVQSIYLEVADNDGLVSAATLEVLLDTAPPSVPTYTVKSGAAKDGFSNSLTPTLTVENCNDVSKVFVTEDLAKTPISSDFTLDCSAALTGAEVSLSAAPGAKELRLWTLDAAGQVSQVSRGYLIKLDQTAPSLSITPNDTDPFPSAIRIAASTDLEADVHYTTDLSEPSRDSPRLPGELALFNDATFRVKAIDFAGNESSVVQRQYTIDRDGPILGTITVNDSDSILNTRSAPLSVSAVGATSMGFAIDKQGLSDATMVPYATSYGFNVPGTSEGKFTIYAKFADQAGNVIGANAEISTEVTIDTTAPLASRISLLTPASPSGDFDKQLVWSSTLEEVTYEVQVCKTATCTACANGDTDCIARFRPATGEEASMRTTEKSLTVSPTLELSGVYYWRVRAVDVAGNASDWVASGTDLKFELRVLASAFASRRIYRGRTREAQGTSTGDRFYGRAFANLGDLDGADNVPEVAVSIGETLDEYVGGTGATNICNRCPAVSVRNIATKKELARVIPPALDPNIIYYRNEEQGGLFGRGMVACDVIDGGGTELVVSAPTRSVRIGGKDYHNYGTVYVYKWVDNKPELAATYVPPVTNKQFTYGDTSCDQNTYGCGSPVYRTSSERWTDFSLPFGSAVASTRYGPFTGWAVTCEPRGSGGDRLWIAEPGYAGADALQKGRLLQLEMSNNDLVATGAQIVGPSDNEGFAASLLHLPSFSFNAGACSGEVLAVGAIKRSPVNRVYLYKKTGAAWDTTPCGTIDAESTDPYDNAFGATLADLGNIDHDGGGFTELAIGAPRLFPATYCSSSAGFVRIYGNDSATALKHAAPDPYSGADCYQRFGFHISRAGDFDGDASGDILISASQSRVTPHESAGLVAIYKWTGLDDGATGNDPPTPFKEIKGVPQPYGFFGTSALVVPPAGGDFDDEPQFVMFGRPGATLQPEGGSYNCSSGGGEAAGGVFKCLGAAEEFAASSLKIGDPSKIVGNTRDAAFGHTIAAVSDLDSDKVGDLVIGQPGGRCNGLNWGSLVVLSGSDTAEIRQICGPSSGSRLGDYVSFHPSTTDKLISFSFVKSTAAELVLYTRDGVPPGATTPEGILDPINFGTAVGTKYEPNPAVASSGVVVSPSRRLTPAAIQTDYLTIGQRSASAGSGNVHFLNISGATQYNATVVTGDGARPLGASADVGEFKIGASTSSFYVMGAPAGNRVYTCRNISAGTIIGGACTTDPVDGVSVVEQGSDPTKLMYNLGVVADPTASINAGTTIEDGFGSLVVALPDLDGADSGITGSYDAFFYVANTSLALDADATATAQYFIIAANVDGLMPPDGWVKILHKSTDSEPGTLLGAAAHIITDIDGDDIPDLAVAAPKGLGAFGNTGHVRILSLGKLVNADATDDLIQVIFNPDNAASNFGVAVTRADINGDGLSDILIGADRYSAGDMSNAGAVYKFPLEGVKK